MLKKNREEKSFYTYQITASNSEKYYFGVSHVPKNNVTIEECLTDGYFGSGGTKFKNWKKKHRKFLLKTILEIFDNKEDAFAAEEKLVGNLYKTDANCLNSRRGGIISGKPIILGLHENFCDKHGKTFFTGFVCRKCSAEKTFTIKKLSTSRGNYPQF